MSQAVCAYRVTMPLKPCRLRMDMVSAQTAGHLAKGHCESLWCHRIGLDRDRRTRVAPELEQVMGHTHDLEG